MKRAFKTAAVLLLGLVVAQVIATLQVYFSNADLHRTLLVLKEAGYLIVPNQQILPRLLTLKPAFWGGLFFHSQHRSFSGLSLMVSGMGLESSFPRKSIVSFFLSPGVADIPRPY